MLRARSMLPALVAAATLLVLPVTAEAAGLGRPHGDGGSTGLATGSAPTPTIPILEAPVATTAGGKPLAADPVNPVLAARPLSIRAARKVSAGDPLAVTIDSLSPSVIPTTGPITVTGTVTNVDKQTWRTVKLYATFLAEPMTTEAELAAAASSDATTYVGNRIIDYDHPGTSDQIDVLEPGQSKRFSFYVARSALVGTDGQPVTTPGVYWFGVHALGENRDGRDLLADGRARTFLPLVPARAEPIATALVVPVRREVVYSSDGTIDDLPGWTQTLSPGGRLRSLVELGAAAGGRRISWLVDPAVVDAVEHIAAGNLPRSIAPNLPPGGKDDLPSASPSPSTSPSTSSSAGPAGLASISARSSVASPGAGPTATPTPTDSPTATDTPSVLTPVDLSPEVRAAQAAATQWLSRLKVALAQQQILGLPYGDPDVAGAAAHDPDVYTLARQRTGTSLAPWGLPLTPVVGSPSGYIDADAVRLADAGSVILATDRLLDRGTKPVPAVASADGRRLVVTSSAAAAGGPAAGDPLALIGLRQRILSEAALRAIRPGRRPLVVDLPENWTPAGTAGFFAGLDADFVDLTDVATAARHPAQPIDLDRLDYPNQQAEQQLGASSFEAARQLIRAGASLQDILLRNDRVGGQVTDQALAATSYSARYHATTTAATALASSAWIDAKLEQVVVSGPTSVTLSSASGRFAATVLNNFDQPVTVHLAAVSDPDVTISVPRTIEIAAGGRKSILLDATTTKNGVHQVTLYMTDSQGRRIGSHDDVPIRAAEVSNLIWLALGLGATLLFGTLALRIARRVRAAARPS